MTELTHHDAPVLLRRWIVRSVAGPLWTARGPHFDVAIVKLDRLGDFVLALGAVRTLLERHGAERCLLVVSPVAAELAAREFPSTPRLVLPHSLGHWRAFKAAIRHRRTIARLVVERVVCLRHQRWDYDELVLSWFNSPICIRADDDTTRRFHPELRLFACTAPGAFQPRAQPTPSGDLFLCRELELHREVLERALTNPLTAAEIVPRLSAPAESQGIVVSPCGSQRIKDFPEPLLQVALRHAVRCVPDPIIFVGDHSQRRQLEQMAERCGDQGARIRVLTHLGLDEYFAIVSRARLVISADTATAHIATAADRSAIILLGGGHFGQFGPWQRSRRQIWLNHPMTCNGCNWSCQHPEPYCLTRINAADVCAAIAQALAENPITLRS